MKLTNLMFAACAGLVLVACDGPGAGKTSTNSTGSVPGSTTALMGMGDKNAPATLVEYASITCSHCATFHNEVWPEIEPRVRAGELRYEFREFPTPPVPIAVAGFRIARCTGEDTYFEVLDDLFKNQTNILLAAQQGVAPTALQTIAARHGLSKEQFDVCVRDKELLATIEESIDEGIAKGVSGTPAFFLNGRLLTKRDETTAEGLNALIDEANGIKREEASAEDAPSTDPAPAGE